MPVSTILAKMAYTTFPALSHVFHEEMDANEIPWTYHDMTRCHGIGRGAKFVKVIIGMDSYLFELTVGTLPKDSIASTIHDGQGAQIKARLAVEPQKGHRRLGKRLEKPRSLKSS